MRRTPQVDFAAYGQSIAHFFLHLSILIAPLCGAAIALLLEYLGQTMTDPIGNVGAGIYTAIAQVVFFCAFGVAIVQANNIWRGRGASLAQAWQETRLKMGGLALAALGFAFVVFWFAGYVGAALGLYGLSPVLQLIAGFFLIYTLPAAAIGGIPGGMAISASIRAVRANPAAALVLTIVGALLWIEVPYYAQIVALPWISPAVSAIGYNAFNVVIEAIVLGYLAFPFAKQYDDIAFRAYW